MFYLDYLTLFWLRFILMLLSLALLFGFIVIRFGVLIVVIFGSHLFSLYWVIHISFTLPHNDLLLRIILKLGLLLFLCWRSCLGSHFDSGLPPFLASIACHLSILSLFKGSLCGLLTPLVVLLVLLSIRGKFRHICSDLRRFPPSTSSTISPQRHSFVNVDLSMTADWHFPWSCILKTYHP